MRMDIVVWAVIVLTTSLAAQPEKAVWNFDTDPAHSFAKGFMNAVGEWKVVADPTAPSRPNVLAQEANNSSATFNVTLISDTRYRDLDLSVKMKAVAGRMDQGGGVVWRARDAKNYYIARYNPLEDNYRVYTVVNGRRTQLQSANITHTDGWHTLRVTMTGDHIEGYYDGKKYLDVKDATFKEAGQIGLWTKADAQSRFDDVMISGK